MTKDSTLPLDPNVKLPAAVRAAVARSNEIVASLNGEVTSEGNAPPVDPVIAEKAPDATTQPQNPPSAQAPAEKPPAKEPAKDSEDWERRYNAMKGRFDRSEGQVKDLSEQIQNLHGMIASMQIQAPSTPLPEASADRLITDDEARDYGEDFLKVVGKKAQEQMSPLLAKISELEKKVQGVGSVVAQDAHTKLLNNLDEKLPNWRDLNTNDDFLSWLRLPDPYSGAIRHDMLKAAYAAGNSSRVIAFFNGFLSEEAAVDPARGDPDDGITEKVAKIPLAKLAAPGRAKTAAGNTAPAEKPIFTRAQITAFYADVANGKYRGRDADKNKLEVQLFDAQREGRIR